MNLEENLKTAGLREDENGLIVNTESLDPWPTVTNLNRFLNSINPQGNDQNLEGLLKKAHLAIGEYKFVRKAFGENQHPTLEDFDKLKELYIREVMFDLMRKSGHEVIEIATTPLNFDDIKGIPTPENVTSRIEQLRDNVADNTPKKTLK